MDSLQKIIKYKFKNKSLLETALTHKSYLNEANENTAECNERLEFLGDSVLGFVVAEYLYLNFPDKDEGIMSRARAATVCEDALSEIARDWNLGRLIFLSHGEEKNNGRTRNSILSDAVESVIAAVYLDAGFSRVKKLILTFFAPKIDAFMENHTQSALNFDYKTALQELCQKNGTKPVYKLVSESGPDHNKSYVSAVFVDNKIYGEAKDTSKKKSEQKAAQEAYKILTKGEIKR